MVNKGLSCQGYGFSSGHVWMWSLDYKDSWALKNSNVVLEKTLESPLDCKGIQPIHPKGNQSWIFIGRTAAETEAPILWPPCMKKKTMHWWRPWCWERLKAGGEGGDRGWDFGWCHWLNGHALEQLWEMVMGRKAWSAVVHRVSRSQTWLNNNNKLVCPILIIS